MEKEYHDLLQLIHTKYGLNGFVYDEEFVIKTIQKRMNSLHYIELKEYLLEIQFNQFEVKTLFEMLNINYSQFFRDPLSFAIMEKLVLPSLLNLKSNETEIRIWSAGCASGQEAYSIAILLAQFSSLRGKAIKYRIFASDISSESLERAQIGYYDEFEVENLKVEYLNKYFKKVDNGYLVSDSLKENITFSAFNLLDEHGLNPKESVFGKFDLIICSNVLYYYNDESQKKIIYKLLANLSPGGYLVSSESERLLFENVHEILSLSSYAAVFRKSQFDRKTEGKLYEI